MLSITWLCFLDLLLFGLVKCVAGPTVAIGVDDVAHWPFSPGLFVKWVSLFR